MSSTVNGIPLNIYVQCPTDGSCTFRLQEPDRSDESMYRILQAIYYNIIHFPIFLVAVPVGTGLFGDTRIR